MIYRTATAADIEAIARLHADSWRRNYASFMSPDFLADELDEDRLGTWRERLSAPPDGQCAIVAEDERGLAGFVCAFLGEDPLWGSYIDNLHVAHDRQRSGAGAVLMREVAQWLEARRPELGVYLWVLDRNERARRFYDHLGARNVETVVKDYPGGSKAPNCRYVWESPRSLLDGATPRSRRARNR